MPNNRVQVIKTTVSDEELATAIINVADKEFGENLNKNQVNLILAQNAHETNYRKNMYNYNVGNIKYTGNKDKYDFIVLNTKEYINDTSSVKVDAKFRAYESLEEGVKDYLNLIRRKPSVWKAISSGDPDQFAHALKMTGYYTAPEKDYGRSLKMIYDNYGKKNNDLAMVTNIQSKKTNFKDTLNRIFNLVNSMERSIAAYDDMIKERFLKKGTYGN